MEVNRQRILLTIFATLIIAVAGVGKASTTTMALDPPEVKDIEPGETFNVNVTVTDVSNLFLYQFMIRFDPNVLQVENITEGPFLASTGEETDFRSPRIDNKVGYVIQICLFMPPFPEEGATGDGVLATIAFSVTGRGTIALEFEKDEEFTYLREVIWLNYTATPPEGNKAEIAANLVDGTFTNGGAETLSLQFIVAIVVVVALCGVVAFYIIRRRT